MSKEKTTISLAEKVNLTIEEASIYTNIGQHKIRELTRLPNCDFILRVGTKTLIKREKFIKFLENCTVI